MTRGYLQEILFMRVCRCFSFVFSFLSFTHRFFLQAQFDEDHALVLCQMHDFKAGILVVYEHLKLYMLSATAAPLASRRA